jgi:Uma2 family endonuclease
MSTAGTQTRYTPEDLLRMPDGDRFELVDGQLVELNMSTWSSYVAGRVYRLVANHTESNHLGWPFPENTSYQCFSRYPTKVRRPDFSFIASGRLTLEQAREEGHGSVVPDLVAEVVSPNDTYYQVETKVKEWKEAGVRLLWIINPETNSVHIYRADGTDATLEETDEISGEVVVPGFRCKVLEFFLPPVPLSRSEVQ